jgi:predicted peroxiredoxin
VRDVIRAHDAWDAGAIACGELVFLLMQRLRTLQPGEQGFAPLKDLLASFVHAGGTIYVCSPCFKKRALDESALVAGATIVGGAKLVEFLAGGAPCISY